jgi:hypothetical protein
MTSQDTHHETLGRRFEYCPNCGEQVDSGYTENPREAPCDNCEINVEPVDDADDASMPFKALHPIRCTECREYVQLVGLHMGKYSDGVLVACECFSIEAIPAQLGEPELPQDWKIVHDAEVYSDE